MFLPIIVKYALKKYGIDLEKLLKKYPFLKIDSKPEEEIKDTSFVDNVVEKMNTGLFLKSQLGLLDLPYVYIRRMLRSSIFYYEVIFDTYLKRSIPYSVIKNLTFHKAFVFRGDNLNRKIFSPPIPIESFNGKIPSNAIIIKLDIAGKYYSKLKEDYKVFKKDKELLKEFSLSDWYKNGLSARNWKFYNQRKDYNTKINLSKITYNGKSGSLLLQWTIKPTFLNIPNIQQNGRVEKEVTVVKKDGSTGKGKNYSFQIKFEDIRSWIKTKEDWNSLDQKDKLDLIRDMIKNYDNVKLFSSSPSWLFQGSWKRADELDASIYDFPELPDSGYWAGLHGNSEIYASKHFIGIYQSLQFWVNDIVKAINEEFEKRGEI